MAHVAIVWIRAVVHGLLLMACSLACAAALGFYAKLLWRAARFGWLLIL